MYSQKQKSPEISTKSRLCLFLAEGVRFELTKGLRPRQFSRLVHSTALPTFLRKPRIIHELPGCYRFAFLENASLENTWVSPAIHEHVLTVDVACVFAAQEGASGTEFVRVAEAAGWCFGHALHADFFRCFAGQFGRADEAAAQTIGFEAARQQVVDGHAALGDVARDAGDESGQPRAGAVGQAEVVARRFDRAAGDVDDTAPAACDHLIDSG